MNPFRVWHFSHALSMRVGWFRPSKSSFLLPSAFVMYCAPKGLVPVSNDISFVNEGMKGQRVGGGEKIPETLKIGYYPPFYFPAQLHLQTVNLVLRFVIPFFFAN